MELLKKAFKSKSVWSGLGKIVAGLGLLATGEQAFSQQAPELLLAVWGIVDIIIRFRTDAPIEDK